MALAIVLGCAACCAIPVLAALGGAVLGAVGLAAWRNPDPARTGALYGTCAGAAGAVVLFVALLGVMLVLDRPASRQ